MISGAETSEALMLRSTPWFLSASLARTLNDLVMAAGLNGPGGSGSAWMRPSAWLIGGNTQVELLCGNGDTLVVDQAVECCDPMTSTDPATASVQPTPHHVSVRFFDSDAFNGRITDVVMWEAESRAPYLLWSRTCARRRPGIGTWRLSRSWRRSKTVTRSTMA